MAGKDSHDMYLRPWLTFCLVALRLAGGNQRFLGCRNVLSATRHPSECQIFVSSAETTRYGACEN
jgi:hypothetical protein